MTDQTNPDTAVAEIEAALRYASDGPWEMDREYNEDGEYGAGPDPDRGYNDFIIMDAEGRSLFGSENSIAKVIEVESDDDGYVYAWDRVAERNAALIVALRNNAPTLLRLISDLRAENARLAEVDRRCGKDNCMGQRVDGCRSWVSKEAFDRLTVERDVLREALEALVIESGGKAIPNSSLTIAREKAIATLTKATGTPPDSGAGPNPATRGSAPAVASAPTRNEDQSDG